ncbi:MULTISPECIES: AraC family transcriptional regulator ligand-binding domain-containing protein [Klebsiella pneumoniae complex]|uniref:AraC family transcriptional regulator ligand-binding domain-containing protein n=1 Tax=Klebsiella pneumoniae complex TaxID=3390273 RepID=UPI001E51CB86|nr:MULTISPECIES: AraC family transcriptional regulator ligand-binding domain-containing protein [Klebsiella]
MNSTDNEGDHSIPLIVFISAHDYFSFWRALEIESDDAMSPLRVIETLTTQTFSPPLFAALCSPNLILAAQRLATYKKLVCPMELILDVGREGDLTVSPRWLTLQPEAPLSLQIAEIAFFCGLPDSQPASLSAHIVWYCQTVFPNPMPDAMRNSSVPAS